MDIPGRDACLSLLRERKLMEHVVQHSMRVAEIAGLLARRLIAAGCEIDLPLTLAAAMLHDIAKIECLTSRADHAEVGQEIVTALGYPAPLGEIIRYHVRLPAHMHEEGSSLAEAHIVNYADKRVNGIILVSLTERFDYIRGRYGRTEDIVRRITELEGLTRGLERRLWGRIGLEPNDLLALLEEAEPSLNR